jgi:hypothetical protein
VTENEGESPNILWFTNSFSAWNHINHQVTGACFRRRVLVTCLWEKYEEPTQLGTQRKNKSAKLNSSARLVRATSCVTPKQVMEFPHVCFSVVASKSHPPKNTTPWMGLQNEKTSETKAWFLWAVVIFHLFLFFEGFCLLLCPTLVSWFIFPRTN